MDITRAEVRCFLHTGSRVVKEHQQSSVTQSVSSIRRQRGQRAFDFIAFEEDCFREVERAFWNIGHLLSLFQPLRESLADVFEERAERRQSLVA